MMFIFLSLSNELKFLHSMKIMIILITANTLITSLKRIKVKPSVRQCFGLELISNSDRVTWSSHLLSFNIRPHSSCLMVFLSR